jgi:phosphate transport system substrate-binding protein
MSEQKGVRFAACFLLAVGLSVQVLFAAETIKIGGTGGALGTMRMLGEAFRKQYPNMEVVVVLGLGSGGGPKALMGGALDVAVTARPWKRREKADGAVARLYGWSPFVMAVSAANPTANLTIQNILDIHSGKKTTWPDGQRLRLILRPLTDSDTQMLLSRSPDMEQAVKSAHQREGMNIAITDEESADAIQSTPGAVGTSMVSLIVAENRPLKALAIKGVAPSVKTIADGSYPWFKSFYLVTKADSPPSSRLFVEFVLSPRGRQLLSTLDYGLPMTQPAP